MQVDAEQSHLHHQAGRHFASETAAVISKGRCYRRSMANETQRTLTRGSRASQRRSRDPGSHLPGK
ncbi:hypothetical protein PSCLAVI8L_130383 [Pseudoclavibacter sp. 8L]|nr:hypothetical protein PSCLAVI8L_130383 [Pseudoclavibacter sp. 8L]